MDFSKYEIDPAIYDEMFQSDGVPRAHSARILNEGITFTVYGDDEADERIIPIDCLPRTLPDAEWRQIEAGLAQRVRTLNLFLADVYGDGRVIADGVIPEEMVHDCPQYRAEMRGFSPPHGTWVAVCGTDVVRTNDGFLVLEDNLRVPSGVSYMIANRKAVKSSMRRLYRRCRVREVEHYGHLLLATLREIAPPDRPDPCIALLTPGVWNSAFYEHVFLARELGAELVEGRDLLARDGFVYMRTTEGLRQVDVIYRRVDDDFLDPLAFRPDSLLGVPGLLQAYRLGNVSLANAPGTGVADWMGRYIERTEHICRLLRVQMEVLVDRPVSEINLGWRRIYVAVGRQPPSPAVGFAGTDDDFALADSFTLADDLTFERMNPDSVRNCFSNGRENARQTRHCISGEMWTCLNLAWLRLRERRIQDIWKTAPESFYTEVAQDMGTFLGVMDATMYRDDGWRFLQLGRAIERVGPAAHLRGLRRVQALLRHRAASGTGAGPARRRSAAVALAVALPRIGSRQARLRRPGSESARRGPGAGRRVGRDRPPAVARGRKPRPARGPPPPSASRLPHAARSRHGRSCVVRRRRPCRAGAMIATQTGNRRRHVDRSCGKPWEERHDA